MTSVTCGCCVGFMRLFVKEKSRVATGMMRTLTALVEKKEPRGRLQQMVTVWERHTLPLADHSPAPAAAGGVFIIMLEQVYGQDGLQGDVLSFDMLLQVGICCASHLRCSSRRRGV